MLYVWVIIFIVSLFVLIKSSDYFVEYAKKIAEALKIPEFIIGVTLVAIGTSLPELLTGLFATIKNETPIVVANAFGSNIANILLVIGVLAVMSKKVIKTEWEITKIDVPLLAIATVIAVFIAWDGKITWVEGLFAILAYFIYMTYALKESSKQKEQRVREDLKFSYFLIVFVTAIGIYFGAKYTIESVINLSQILGIATTIIAATAVALGTSLPELMVSIMALKKGNHGMALGNVLGSNIFNSLMVVGVPSLVKTLTVDTLTLSIVTPFMVAVTLMYLFIIADKEVSEYEGAMMMLVYFLFILKIIGVI